MTCNNRERQDLETRDPLHWLAICLLILLPLSIATVNPGTGLASGFVASTLAFGVALVVRGLAVSWDRTSWTVALAAAVIILSPYWNSAPTAPHSASRSAAAAVAFVLVVRWTVRTRRDFHFTVAAIAFGGSVYAIYFLDTAKALDVATARLSVGFSNANYTAAVFGFSVICSVLTLSRARAGYAKVLIAAATLVQVLALVGAGSRAATAGVVVATGVFVVARRWDRRSRVGTGIVLGASFIVGFVPDFSQYLDNIAVALDGYGPFHRSALAVADSSGRTEIWRATRAVIDEAPWLGWGPGDYYLPVGAPPYFLAHSWALEYVAALGFLGAALIAVLLAILFTKSGPADEPYDFRWNAASAVSIAPVLALSTHQWTLWAWFAFALWSRSYLIAAAPAAVFVSPPAEATVESGLKRSRRRVPQRAGLLNQTRDSRSLDPRTEPN